MGTLSCEASLGALYDADCVVAFGAGLNPHTTASGSLLSTKRVVHVDVEPARIGHYIGVDVGLVGDAATVADIIVQQLDEANIPPTSFRSRITVQPGDDPGSASGHESRTPGTVDLRTALQVIDAAVPADRLFVTDPGRHLVESWTQVHVQSPRKFIYPANFGAIGTGMASAIGAAFAHPETTVLMVGGDGGFMLGGLSEFSTAVRYRINLLVVLCNDGAYGAEHMQLVERGMPAGLVEFEWPDLAEVATALGGRGIAVRNDADLDHVAGHIRNQDRPLLIDLRLDPRQIRSVPH
jgi:thiamine pyrophosphate-dependent acetolactate synthase large subunit-like protein